MTEPRVSVGARAVAIAVLFRVAEEGAYASRALDAELGRSGLSALDVGLATEIVYGTLRVLPDLDALIAKQVSRDPARMDGVTRAALRSAAYQLNHLSRVPAHAVVDETVTVVRDKRGAKLAGFTNAVLRKLAGQRPADPMPPTRLSVPEWVRAELLASLGDERMRALLDERVLPPPLGLRVAPQHTTRDAFVQAIAAVFPNAQIETSTLSPQGLCVRRGGAPRALPGYKAGHFSVQEEGAQLVALALGVQPGERVADVCAGHGGKTTLFAEQVGDAGHVTAIDVDERKLERIPEELRRLQLSAARVDTQAIDVSVGTGGLPASFDRVLVDAPCSGLGTIHRRPELLLRLQKTDPARMAELQLRILLRAAKLVRPEGLLAYAVCSPTRAECAEVADRFQREVPHARRIMGAIDAAHGGWASPDADGILRIGPWLAPAAALCAPDAYQLVAFRL